MRWKRISRSSATPWARKRTTGSLDGNRSRMKSGSISAMSSQTTTSLPATESVSPWRSERAERGVNTTGTEPRLELNDLRSCKGSASAPIRLERSARWYQTRDRIHSLLRLEVIFGSYDLSRALCHEAQK